MRPVRNTKDVSDILRGEIDDIRRQLQTLRGDGGLGQVYGCLDMNRGRVVNASPSQQQNDYVTRGELEDAMGTQLKFKRFTSASATFDLDDVAASETSVLVFANAGLLQYGDTGKTGYSVSLTGGTGAKTRITTVRTMLATDNVLVVYIKKAL